MDNTSKNKLQQKTPIKSNKTDKGTKTTAIGYLTIIGYLNNTKRIKYNMILRLLSGLFLYINRCK